MTMVFTRSRTSPLRPPALHAPRARGAWIDSGPGYEALLGLIMFAGHEPSGEVTVGDVLGGPPVLDGLLAEIIGRRP
jgi:hypothetical protein